jgi:hypothetical protein
VTDLKLRQAIESAVRIALAEIGIEKFKQTSFFVCASKAKSDLKQAA